MFVNSLQVSGGRAKYCVAENMQNYKFNYSVHRHYESGCFGLLTYILEKVASTFTSFQSLIELSVQFGSSALTGLQ